MALRGAWWIEDNGPPWVGSFKDDNRPVALVPGKRGYVLHEPVSGKSLPVSEDLAMSLSPVAHTFYPPLPDRKLTAWT